jgi:hypothetical protein
LSQFPTPSRLPDYRSNYHTYEKKLAFNDSVIDRDMWEGIQLRAHFFENTSTGEALLATTPAPKAATTLSSSRIQTAYLSTGA